MSSLLESSLLLALIGQMPVAAGADFAAESEARLAYMKESVRVYDIRSADDPGISFELQAEPVLRFTNPVGRARDGSVFLWLDGERRPRVVAQATLNLRGIWVHEFSSLSPVPFTAKSSRGPVWSPSQGGVAFRPVPGAPKPARTVELRLMQMRALAREFTVEDEFERQSWQRLRLLPKPFARYGMEGSGTIDGALFCFVLTTDPEAYMMLEARVGEDGREWQYAFAPSTFYPLRASLRGKPVWERNIERPEGGPEKTLYQLRYSDEKVSAGPKAP